MPDAATFSHRLTVRFRDCDAMAHVNHAVYFTYFEQARLAWYHALGGGTAFPGVSTIVVHAECDYRAPAYVHEELDVTATVTRIGRTSIAFDYALTNVATGQRLADGKTVSVTVDPDTQRPVPVPEKTRKLLGGVPLEPGAPR